jgi:alpha-L-fucosidase 2
VQSHEGCVALLPALPRAWPAGRVRGLRARGGFEVDVAWRDGALAEARVVSRAGAPLRVRLPPGTAQERVTITRAGAPVRAVAERGLLALDTAGGATYVIAATEAGV